jgi:hypothetical protein
MIGRTDHHVGVFRLRVPGLGDFHPARHAEVRYPSEVTFDVEKQELALTAQGYHAPTLQTVGKVPIPRLPTQHPRPARFSVDDPLAGQVGLEAPPGGLYFW